MDQRRHDIIASWERRWLALSGLLSLVFVILIAWSLATEGTHIAQRVDRATPEQLLSNAQFAAPGVRQLAPGRFQVTMVARQYAFSPAEIVLPVGAEVDFYATSADVLHGYQLANTNVNVKLIPGEVAAFRYTFDRPGEYRVACNEYCGIVHHAMLGQVTVLSASDYGRARQQADAAAADAMRAAQEGGAGADGAAVYAANCVSCHQAEGQGLPGVFPPLAGHAPTLLEAGRDYLPTLMLYGLQGAIEIDGASYNGVMPGWQQLSDAELAAVIEHILGAWGNDALLPDDHTPYTPDEIAAARGQGLSAQDVYELRQQRLP